MTKLVKGNAIRKRLNSQIIKCKIFCGSINALLFAVSQGFYIIIHINIYVLLNDMYFEHLSKINISFYMHIYYIFSCSLTTNGYVSSFSACNPVFLCKRTLVSKLRNQCSSHFSMKSVT